jgi:hypothetical protein
MSISRENAVLKARMIKDEHEQLTRVRAAELQRMQMDIQRFAANTADEVAKLVGQYELMMELFDLTDAEVDAAHEPVNEAAKIEIDEQCGECSCGSCGDALPAPVDMGPA